MVFLRNMRLSSKFFLVLTLMAVITVSIMGLAIRTITHLAGAAQRIVAVEAESAMLATSSREHMARVLLLSHGINHAQPGERAYLRQRWNIQWKAMAADLKKLRPLLEGEDVIFYESIVANRNEFSRVWEENLRLLESEIAATGDSAPAYYPQTNAYFFAHVVPLFPKLDAASHGLAQSQQRRLTAAGLAAEREGREAIWTLSAISAACVGSLSLIILLILRQIIGPLSRATKAMRRLAEGDLGVTLEDDGARDELGDLARAFGSFRQSAIDNARLEAEAAEQRQLVEETQAATAREQAEVVQAIADGLARLAAGNLSFRLTAAFPEAYDKLREDFNAAMEQLQEAMKLIAVSAMGIRTGTDEISLAADELSRRTEQQAASLEESAAALDEITTTVRRTAEGANEASRVVAATTADAEKSGLVVREAVGAMSDIEKSSTQISQIVSVIDEIAFQTNLLALNAGVEAARAGEAGRGFAVVASEVRALAQRSAAAAKEIKALIATSTGQVNIGVQLVGQTGEALERILAKVAEINSLVAEIAGSAKEQALSLHEVNGAVDQMDQVTQQNASMVEESTAASFALASEAQQLTDLIGRFDIGAGSDRAPQPVRHTRTPDRRPPPVLRSVSGAAVARKLDAEPDAGWEEF